MNQPQCQSCKQPMEPGFLIDEAGAETPQITKWGAGEPKQAWIAAEPTKAQVASATKVRAYRCPKCYRLDLFAIPHP